MPNDAKQAILTNILKAVLLKANSAYLKEAIAFQPRDSLHSSPIWKHPDGSHPLVSLIPPAQSSLFSDLL